MILRKSVFRAVIVLAIIAPKRKVDFNTAPLALQRLKPP
jgi:hypothetical protein